MTGARFFALAGALCLAVPALAQQGARDGEWRAYSGDRGSTKYSALDQINASNFKDLRVAWRWKSTDAEVEPGAPPGFKVSPLYVKGVLYTATMYGMAAAIDPKSGETLWKFDPEVWKGRRPGNLGFNARGVAYWEDENGNGRIFLGTQHNYLYALDAKTGQLIKDFGENGVVDLNANYRRPVPRDQVWAISPPVICRDVVIMGRAINDGPVRKEAPPGDVFAYDVRTGKHKWTFYNPPLEGQVGYDTWKEGSADYTGNSNVWSHFSSDEELGLVYLPFTTPTNDWYGGHRKGQNLFAESLVCVKYDTGELVWYFQHVHHGLWDYDLPTAPALVDVTVDGKPVKALAQMTKQGFLWVLDRTTGKPVWPIEERPVPQSTVPGEETWPTQPFPTKPAPYDLQGSTEDTLIDYTPELKAQALEILKQYKSGPLYTPPDDENGKPTIFNPGWGGGGNWSGCSIDPETGWVYIPSVSGAAITLTLSKPNPDISNFRYVGQPGMGIQGPQGLPLFKGPYSRVTAIDLNTGEHVWQIPIGKGPIDHPALKDLNLPPLGGRGRGFPLATKTLLFLAVGGGGFGGRGAVGGGQGGGGQASAPAEVSHDAGLAVPEGREGNLWAIDKKTGETVGQLQIPGSPSGPLITYLHEGKQYLVMSMSGERRGPGEYVALALP